jgi:peptidoglycan hydrolase-like protein with peptidoglycan-binding domain
MFSCNLKRGDSGENVRMVQKALNEKTNLASPLVTDGDFGPSCEAALRAYQKQNNLQVTGIYGTNENVVLGELIDRKFLMLDDIEHIASIEGLPSSVLKAFSEVEGNHDGFFTNGLPVILFERHKFYKALSDKFGTAKADSIASDICNKTPGGYIGGIKEYDRLNRAIGIDRECAQASASWGMFQLMGFNYKACGYNTLDTFITDMYTSEDLQLAATVNFIKANPALHKAIVNKDFVGIAQNYNGRSEADHTPSYHEKLAAAEAKYK